MKKLHTLIIALILSGLTQTYAQLGNGWDSAFNFGGAGNNVTEMRYDANGNLYFLANVMGKNLFAGTQIDPGGFGSYPTTEIIYGKIAPNGTQTLLKRIAGSSGESRLDADGNLYMILTAGFPTAPIDFGNGIINNTNGAKLLKISNTGVAQWMKPIKTGSKENYGAAGVAVLNVQGMQFTPDGNLYVVTAANGVALNPPTPQFTNPHRIIKFNANGDEAWHTEVFSNSGLAGLTVPKMFVDDAGQVTFAIYATSNQWFYNGEAIASQMSTYNTTVNVAYSIIISLNADGSKKNTIADTGTNTTTTFSGLNPINGNKYIEYGAFAAAKSNIAPFSTLPNQTLGLFSESLYTFGGTLVYNNAGQYVKYLLGKDAPVLSTIVRNGSKFVSSLNLMSNVIFEKGDYIFNSTTDYSFIEFLDQDFNFIKALKGPKTSLMAAYQDKLCISGEFKTPLTFGSKTLIPNFNDPDFVTRFPIFTSIKSDMFIAVADAAVIAPPVAVTWLGIDNNWNNTANWSSGQVPDATSIVKFNANSAQQPTVATAPTALKVTIDAGITASLPTDLAIKNKLIINGTLQINHTGVLNFSNYGASVIEGIGTIAFNGTSTPSVNAFSLIGHKDLSLSVNSNTTIAGGIFKNVTFTGTNAIISSFSGIEITNPNPNAISGYSATNYIAGKITRAVNASGTYVFSNLQFVFPNLKPEPTTITLNNLTGTSKITVAMDNGPSAPNLNFATGICDAALGDYYWRITPDVAPTSGTYDVSFQKSVFRNGVTDADRYVVLKRAERNSPWTFEGTKTASTQTGGTTNGSVVSNATVTAGLKGLTQFSDFVIGINSTPVPNDLAVTTSTWTGTTNTTWANATNWSNGVPNATVNGVIPIGLRKYPLIFALGDNAKSLTINNGLNIKLDAGLTLTNGLINNGVVEITDLTYNNYVKQFIVYKGGISGSGKVIFKTLSSVTGGIINNDVEIDAGKSQFNNLDNEINIIGKIGGNINIISGAVRAWDSGGQFLESTNPDATITIANTDFHIAGRVLKSVKTNGTYFLPLGDEQYHRLGTRKYGGITIKNNNLDAPSVFNVYFNSYWVEQVKIVDGATPISEFLNSGQWRISPTVVSKTGTIDIILETKNYTNGRTNVNDYVFLRRDVTLAKWLPVAGAIITETAGQVTVTANGLAPFTATSMFCIGLKANTTQWTGATSTDWNTATNWNNGVPNETYKAQIIAGSPRYPLVATGNTAALLEIGNGVNLKLPQNFTSPLGVVNNGTVEVEGTGIFYGFNNGTTPISGAGNLLFGNNSPSSIDGYYFGSVLNNGLEINKTDGVILSRTLDIGGSLTLNNGILKVDDYVKLNITNPAAAVTGSANSYVNGTLNRKVNSNGTYNFPVGSATAYAPAIITVNNIVGTQYINSSFNSTANITLPSISTNGTVINKTLDNGTWTISPDVALTGGTYDVSLQTSNYSNGVADAELYKIIKRAGPYYFYPWEFLGNTPTATQTGGTLTDGIFANGLINASIKALTGFSEFAIGIADPTVMPVTLVSFKADKVSTGVKLTWLTASEKNSAYFEIEKSTDGQLFTTLGRVNAAGNSSESKYYSLTDFIPANGANYYRLKQVDLDGKTDLSDPVSINFDLEKNEISIYPNPASSQINFTGVQKGAVVSLFDIQGKEILSQKIIDPTLQLPSAIKNGLYMMIIKTNDGFTKHLKVLVSK